MKTDIGSWLKSFLVELVVYAGLVAGYFFLVLHLLGGWLEHLFHEQRRLYAVIALALVLAQGMLLEMLTRFLLGMVKGWREPR